ncbi:helix-turn-helix domain-containing protein [Proteus sp. DFP240708]|uniref:helix-turn-helix domain-containing protein n=1 Tax=Proteus TaxID=583 RepID=UPI000D68BD31|nr:MULTISPECIES: helix-turn-helix transcriptional regulator [Proteus]MBI6510072.1 helix-turn-helix transcriptional regulator [Proteus sp. PR00174]NBM90495.1 helix-turn-helix domain-containing protein [Proteus sp. G2658]
MNIADALDLCLRKKGISKAELAKRTMLSKSYLSRLFSNERTPNLETLENICTALDIPLSLFIFLSSENVSLSNDLKKRMDSIIFDLLGDINETSLS